MTVNEAKEALLAAIQQQILKIGMSNADELAHKVLQFEILVRAEAKREPEHPVRWVACVQQTPFNFTRPMRIMVAADSEEAAKQTLLVSGYSQEFQWHIRRISREEMALGKIISKEFEDDGAAIAASMSHGIGEPS